MRAIILAAGRGKRLGDLTNNQPKCMLQLYGKPLIEWQIKAIKEAGITNIAIVRGYLRESFTYNVNYFENPRWEQTNMFYTLMCANNWLSKHACIISYADIVYTDDVIRKLRSSTADITISYDPNWQQLWEKRFTDPLSDAEVFKFSNNTLLDIGGSANSLHEIQGQYMGLLKFSVNGWNKIKEFIRDLSPESIDKLDMTALLKLLLKNNFKVSLVATESVWCEIDNLHDYDVCQQIMKSTLLDAPA